MALLAFDLTYSGPIRHSVFFKAISLPPKTPRWHFSLQAGSRTVKVQGVVCGGVRKVRQLSTVSFSLQRSNLRMERPATHDSFS